MALVQTSQGGDDSADRDNDVTVWVKETAGWRVRANAVISASARDDGALAVEADGVDGRLVLAAQGTGSADGATLAWGRGGIDHDLVAVAEGLRHLVTVGSAADGSGGIALRFDVEGALYPTLLDEETVALCDADGAPRIRYSGLFVFDARGSRQVAWFEVTDDGFGINVDVDPDAEWPIVIDPIVSGDVLLQGDQALSNFGRSVAAADFNGDGRIDILSGVPDASLGATNNGVAQVYFATTSGQPTFAQSLISPNLQTNGGCGWHVAAGDADNDGDADAVVACEAETPRRIYVFQNDGSGFFGTVIQLAPGALETNLGFGHVDVVDIGNDGLNEVVAGYLVTSVYRLTAGSPSPVSPLEQLDLDQDGSWVPCALTGVDKGVLVSGGGLVRFMGPNPSSHLLTGGTPLNIPATPILIGPGQVGNTIPACGDYDGDGDDDVVFGYPARGSYNGEVYAYRNDGASVFTLVSGFPQAGSSAEELGTNVFSADFNGDRRTDLVVCAPLADSGAVANVGRCLAWGGHPTTALFNLNLVRWTALGTLSQQRLGAYQNEFAAGDTDGELARNIFVPDPKGTTNGLIRIVDAERAGPSSTDLIAPQSNLTNGSLGTSMAVGDINQDGFSDVVVGMPGASSGSGRVAIWLGGTSMSATAARTITASGGDRFGAAIAVGRFRGPSNPPSIAVSEPEWDSAGNNNVGRVWIFNAPVNGIPAATTTAGADYFIPSQTVGGESFGDALASCGSLINATGDCLAVGAPAKPGTSTTNGSVYIYRSTGSGGLVTAPTTSKSGVSNGSGISCAWGFGSHLANAGNVASGADDDLLVGANGCANGSTDEGRVFLYLSQSGSDAISLSSWFAEGNQAGAQMGPVAGLGDVSGDGRPDFAVGAPLLDTNSTDNGRVFVFLGSAGTPSTTAASTMSTTYSGHCGSWIAGGFDVNRDGLMDLIEGEPAFSNSAATPNEGRIRVFPGRLGQGPDFVPLFTLEGGCSNCRTGTAVAMGDFNGSVSGDTYGDVVIGMPGFTSWQSLEGRFLVRVGRW